VLATVDPEIPITKEPESVTDGTMLMDDRRKENEATFAAKLTDALWRAYRGSVRYFTPKKRYVLAAPEIVHATANDQHYHTREVEEGWLAVDVQDQPQRGGVGGSARRQRRRDRHSSARDADGSSE